MGDSIVLPNLGSTVQVESTRPDVLVSHCQWVPVEADVATAQAIFRKHDVAFLAVIERWRVVGLCARETICGPRNGDWSAALPGNWYVRDNMVREFLCVQMDTPLREVLDRAVARRGDRFYDDIVLVDSGGGLVGMVSMKTLVRVQGRLLTRQFESLAAQKDELARANNELVCTVKALRMARARYAALFEGTALPVGVFSVDGFLEEGNSLLRTLFGFGPGHIRPAFSMTNFLTEQDRAELLAMLAAPGPESGNGIPIGRDFRFHLPGRGDRLLNVHVRAIPASEWVCVCFEDVTERHALEQAVAEREKHELLETLVGGIAHELNNKLLPVIGFTELLRKDLDKEGAPEQDICYCDRIETSAQAAARIVKGLLQSSRPALSSPISFDVRVPVQEALDLVHFRFEKVAITHELVLPEDPLLVLGDPAEIHQLLVNLLLNACDAMECADERRLSVSVEDGVSHALVRVRDSGSGIPAEMLHRVFDPFFTTKGPGRGTGLGLSVCYSIAERHHGRIVVEDTGPGGTVFRVSLPLLQGEGQGAAGALHAGAAVLVSPEP